MIIKGAKVYTNENGFKEYDLYIKNGRIVDFFEETPENVVEARGLYAIPGLVDIHTHGAVGNDYCDGSIEGYKKIAEYEAKQGVLAVCPTTMSYDEARLSTIVDSIKQFSSEEKADFVGINMEGPFINPNKAGAQNIDQIFPLDEKMFKRLQERSNNSIKLLDMAPELKGASSFIEATRNSVKLSFAHSDADYDTAKWAFQNGVTHMTHMFNAMQGIGHRTPGPIIAAIEENVEAELIADGVHVHPAMVRFAFSQFNPTRIILISDSMMACGLEDGDYSLGGQKVTVSGKKAVLTDNPSVIAGSATSLFGCMKEAVCNMGIQLEDAIRACTFNPAKSIGIADDYGSLEKGRYGNVLLIDQQMNLKAVFKKGRKIL